MNSKTAVIFVCENYILDIRQKISIINIFDNLNVDKIPFKQPYWVYSYARGWEGSHKFKLTITDPKGNEENLGRIKADLENPKRAQVYIEPLNKEFSEYGEYVFRLYVDDECVAESYLSVIPTTDVE